MSLGPAALGVCALGAFGAGYLLFLFVRDGRGRSALGVGAAALLHVGLLLIAPGRPPAKPSAPELVEFEMVAPPEPVPIAEPVVEVQPEPEPELDAEPEPEAVPTPKKARPASKRREPRRRNVEPKPQAAEPAAPRRFDPGTLNQGHSSGVSVQAGSGGGSGLGGSGGAKKGPPRGRGGAGDGDDGVSGKGGDGWNPTGRVFIAKLPVPKRVAVRQCPATRDGVEGTVSLRVQVRRDGSVRRVRLVRGIGHGCDKIAIAALKQARFKPAKSSSNQPVDFEISYEYVFKLVR